MMLTPVGSTAIPDLPTAARMRPQLGSAPAHAVFTNKECDTICSARDWHTRRRAVENFPGTDALFRRTPLRPLASSSTVSLVEVSPSIEMQLKLWSQASRKTCLNSAEVAAMSVKRYTSMVASWG